MQVVLTLSFLACATSQRVNSSLEREIYDAAVVPSPPELLPVEFVDTAKTEPRTDGLWLSYEDYRNLEINILRMRAYQEDLREIIRMYRSGSGGGDG